MTKVRIALRALSFLTLLYALTPGIAVARQSYRWNVDLTPNSWTSTAYGDLAINGTANTPLFTNFSDANSRTARGSAFHGEARKGKWGFLGDVDVVHLSSDVNSAPQVTGPPISGTMQLNQVIVNGKGMYLLNPGASLYAVAGVRTMTLSPSVHLINPTDSSLADIRGSNTKVAGVIGFVYRPKVDEHLTILTQADIGNGSAVMTWSALGGVEFLVKPWVGVAGWYGALGIAMRNEPKSGIPAVGTVTGDSKFTLKGTAAGITFHLH